MAEDVKHSSSDKELHRWVTEVLDDGITRRRHWEGQWWENLATYSGDLWAEWDPHKGKLWEPRKDDHKVRLSVNLAQPVVRTELAKLVKNRPITDVVAADDTQSALNSAQVGDKMLNHYAEKKFHLPRVRRRMLQWTVITGLGGIFVDYDDTATSEIEVYTDPQGNPIFDERVIEAYKKFYKKKNQTPKMDTVKDGELRVVPLGPMNFLFDFSKLHAEDAAWMIVSEVYDTTEVRRRWGADVEGESDAIPGVLEQRMLSRSDLSQKLMLEMPKSQDLCQVHRMFIKPGHYFFPDGAEIVFTKDELIHKTSFPFDHGELPVSIMGHIPLPISQYQMSILQHIREVVLEISKTESQMIENRNLMSNPPWVEAKQSRIEGEIKNRPGLRIKYTHVPNIPPPQPVQMPNMPQYVQNLVEVLKEHVLEISGQGETSQGRVPPGARSGVAIAYLQEEDDTRLGPTVTEFEETMERSNWQILQVIAQKYDVPRTVRLNRKHSAPEVFDFKGEMLDGVAGVDVQAGSALPRSKAAKQQFILDLWDRQLEQDPRKVREMLELSSGEPDEWEIDLDQAERENRRLETGEEVLVEEWHNHAAHHYKHRNYMKTPDFEALPPAIQENYRKHDAEHTEFEQLQQAQVQIAGMGTDQNMPVETTEAQESQAGAPANGMNNPGPPAQFSNATTPRTLLEAEPQ